MSTEIIEPIGRRANGSRLSARVDAEFEGFLRQVAREQGAEPTSLRAWMDLAETWKITRTLAACRGNRSAAARSLGIGRRTLYAKMEKLGIAPSWTLPVASDRDDR